MRLQKNLSKLCEIEKCTERSNLSEKHDIQELVEFRSVKAKDLDEEPSQLRKMHVNNESKEVLKKKASKPNPQRVPTPCPGVSANSL